MRAPVRSTRPAPARAAAAGAALLALVLLVAALPGALRAQPRPAVDHCRRCHAELDGKPGEGARRYTRDIHYQRGITCAGCHGGDPTVEDEMGMDASKGFRGTPTRAEIVGVCVSCHANAAFMKRYNPRPYIFSLDEFRTSVHGKRQASDPKVATCTSCHSVHDIRPHTDPTSTVFARNVPRTCARCHNSEYMRGRNLPTDQHAQYVQSVHGKALLEKGDLSAPACNDCHGNHGAAPPGVQNITLVCGSCHGREGELFAESPMRIGMEKDHGTRGCVTCHRSHGIRKVNDAMLSAAPGGACADCHEPGSACATATDSIITGIRTLGHRMTEAESLLQVAEVRGMDAEAGREKLRQARDQLVGARAVIHSFDQKRITGVLAEGIGFARQAQGDAVSALRDWRVRRIGLAASLVVILVLIALLVAKIRSLEREGRARPETP